MQVMIRRPFRIEADGWPNQAGQEITIKMGQTLTLTTRGERRASVRERVCLRETLKQWFLRMHAHTQTDTHARARAHARAASPQHPPTIGVPSPPLPPLAPAHVHDAHTMHT